MILLIDALWSWLGNAPNSLYRALNGNRVPEYTAIDGVRSLRDARLTTAERYAPTRDCVIGAFIPPFTLRAEEDPLDLFGI